MSEINKEEYLKLVRALDRLMDLLDETSLVTVSVMEKATLIYNNAEIRTFSETTLADASGEDK